MTLLSRVDVTARHSGSFGGVLTNGNGRTADNGQADYHEFRVPAGTPSLSAEVSIANDKSNQFFGFLVDPHGQLQGVGSNYVGTKLSSGGSLSIAAERQMTVYANHPAAGIWTLVIQFAKPSVGNEISEPYAGRVAFSSG